MNINYLRSILIIDITILLVFSVFYTANNNHKKNVLSVKSSPTEQISTKKSIGLPVRLIIPDINIDTNIESLGINSIGNMETPQNINNAGWFKLGYRPGEIGSAVIAGHLNGKNNENGIFYSLNKLKKGNKIYVEDDNKNLTVFIVQSIQLYNPGYAESLFNSTDKAHLNLITCDGTWDKTKNSYSKRLVVLADISD